MSKAEVELYAQPVWRMAETLDPYEAALQQEIAAYDTFCAGQLELHAHTQKKTVASLRTQYHIGSQQRVDQLATTYGAYWQGFVDTVENGMYIAEDRVNNLMHADGRDTVVWESIRAFAQHKPLGATLQAYRAAQPYVSPLALHAMRIGMDHMVWEQAWRDTAYGAVAADTLAHASSHQAAQLMHRALDAQSWDRMWDMATAPGLKNVILQSLYDGQEATKSVRVARGVGRLIGVLQQRSVTQMHLAGRDVPRATRRIPPDSSRLPGEGHLRRDNL
jgi:hypothetical protein